jgi:sugar phosphate isomerase/epimerase
MRFAICSEIFEKWSPETMFRYAAKAGYDGVEIAPFTLARYVTDIPAAERARLREQALSAGVAITGIHWVLAQAEGMYLNHPDAAVRERTSRYVADLVDFCADLGGRVMVVGSPRQRNIMEGVTADQAWQWAASTFGEGVKRAEDRGVIICFEPLAPAETNFINTAAEAIDFIRQFNSPSMKIILDVKAMCSESKPIPQIIRESWPEIGYFHANDRNMKGPGFGDVDFVPIAAALKEVGYNGWVSVEVFKFEEGPEAIATRSLSYLRRVFGTSAEVRVG